MMRAAALLLALALAGCAYWDDPTGPEEAGRHYDPALLAACQWSPIPVPPQYCPVEVFLTIPNPNPQPDTTAAP